MKHEAHMCACVHACVRACVLACGCACVLRAVEGRGFIRKVLEIVLDLEIENTARFRLAGIRGGCPRLRQSRGERDLCGVSHRPFGQH